MQYEDNDPEKLKPVTVSRHRKEIFPDEPFDKDISLKRRVGGRLVSTGRADWKQATESAWADEIIARVDAERTGIKVVEEPVFCLADAQAAVIRILGPQAEWFNTYLKNRGKRPTTHTPADHIRFGRLCAKLSEAGMYEKEE